MKKHHREGMRKHNRHGIHKNMKDRNVKHKDSSQVKK